MSIFEKAARTKLRFASTKGGINAEDLWDLGLESLNSIAKLLKKTLNEAGEEDFIQTKSKVDEELQLKFDIVLHIINVRKEEINTQKTYQVKLEKKRQLLELINNKENEQTASKSLDELRAELQAL